MENSISRSELESSLKGAMKYAHPKDDSKPTRGVLEPAALILMKSVAQKLAPPETQNSPLDLAVFWFSVGLFTADARHGREGSDLIIIPKVTGVSLK